MNEERIDFSALAAGDDAERWNAAVARTMARVDDVLSARAADPGPFGWISQWTRPILAVAAALLLICTPVIASNRGPRLEAAAALARAAELWAGGAPDPNGSLLWQLVER